MEIIKKRIIDKSFNNSLDIDNFCKVYIKDKDCLDNGFLEIEPGLYEIPYTYHYLGDNIIDENDKVALDTYLSIFTGDLNLERDIYTGFKVPEYWRDSRKIISKNIKSIRYLVSRDKIKNLKEDDTTNISDLCFKRDNYILPEKIKNYYIYKIEEDVWYSGWE